MISKLLIEKQITWFKYFTTPTSTTHYFTKKILPPLQRAPTPPLQKGGMIFAEKNWTLASLCQIVLGSQFKKKKIKCCFLVWRRDSENFEFYPKIGKNKFLFKRFRDLHQRGKSSLIFVKLKMKRNSKTFGYFLCTS